MVAPRVRHTLKRPSVPQSHIDKDRERSRRIRFFYTFISLTAHICSTAVKNTTTLLTLLLLISCIKEKEVGYLYDITVSKNTIGHPPADGSAIQCSLIEVNSKTKVDENTLFEIRLKSEPHISPPSFVAGTFQTSYNLLNEIPIDCDILCEELAESLDTPPEVVGQFVHQGSDGNTLIRLIKSNATI